MGFELEQMAAANNGYPISVHDAVQSGQIVIEEKPCPNCGGNHDMTIIFDKGKERERHIFLFRTHDMLRQIFASLGAHDGNDPNPANQG